MTLLSLCTQAARSMPVDAPAAIVGSSDPTARLLLACAQDAGESLARRAHPKGGWTAQVTEYTFTTVSGQADYTLPTDFRSIVDGTLWDRSQYWEIRGPLSPQQWQAIKSSALGQGTVGRRWRIRNVSGTVKFSVDPTPSASSAGQTLVFEYRSKNWCQSAAGVGQTVWTADADTGILDEYLIRLGVKWRFLERQGMAYLESREEEENEVRQAIARDGGAGVLHLDRPRMLIAPLGVPTVPETGFGS